MTAPTDATVQHVAVVIPAHDEERLLGSCVRSVLVAANAVSVLVDVVVVLDACTDRSAAVCRELGVRTVTADVRNVGRARGAGAAHAAGRAPDAHRWWLASTDADTTVPMDWLSRQIELADAGADLVCGLVRLHPSADVAGDFEQSYRRACHGSAHTHVHGANLGVRGSVYDRVGGWPPWPNHEDHGLVAAAEAMDDVCVVRSLDLHVWTSARADAPKALAPISHDCVDTEPARRSWRCRGDNPAVP